VNGRLALPRVDAAFAGLGVVATALAVAFVERTGTAVGLGLLLGLTAFVGIFLAYVAVPHVAVAVTIPFFAVLPTLKLFVHPLVGGTKDLIAFAGLVAAATLFFRRRAARQPWMPDQVVLGTVGLLLLLYAANVGGYLSGETGYGPAWFHGVRLVFEPLSLLLVGLSLRNPARTLRWGGVSLVATGVAVAFVGFMQQMLGVGRLMEVGFRYGHEVREAFGNLRSFGTLGEPFAYAGFMLLAAAAVLLWARRGVLTAIAAPLILLGLAVSLVRTAAIVVLALIGLAIAQRGQVRFAFLLLLISISGALAVFAVGSQETSTRLVQVSANQYLTLNGRTELWEEALGGERSSWIFGRGVGATGTASQRAQVTLTGAANEDAEEAGIVDSAYLAIVADVGLIGLGLLLALLVRIAFLAWGAAKRGARSGWLALGLLTVMMLDALTRESLTGFPTAYIGMLVVGLAVATWEPAERPARAFGVRPLRPGAP
jgi:O-antigen ligase